MRPGCHAAARPFIATVTTVTIIIISIVPRREKHAAPFWVSLLAVRSKKRRDGRQEAGRRGLKVKGNTVYQ